MNTEGGKTRVAVRHFHDPTTLEPAKGGGPQRAILTDVELQHSDHALALATSLTLGQ